MNDPHGLKDYEQAARASLLVRGANPDMESNLVGKPKLWELEADELRLLDYRLKALARWKP